MSKHTPGPWEARAAGLEGCDGGGCGVMLYSIEVFRRGTWVPTSDQNLIEADARSAMNAWGSLGCDARMVPTRHA